RSCRTDTEMAKKTSNMPGLDPQVATLGRFSNAALAGASFRAARPRERSPLPARAPAHTAITQSCVVVPGDSMRLMRLNILSRYFNELHLPSAIFRNR